jgi:hypothetical protein
MAAYMRTGALTSPKAMLPDQIARGIGDQVPAEGVIDAGGGHRRSARQVARREASTIEPSIRI